MLGGGRRVRKREIGGLKPVCPGRLGKTLLQGHAGSKKRDALLSPSAVPLTVAAPHARALVPGFLPPIRVLPRHSLGDSRETLAMAGPTELYTKLLLLKHRAQQVRLWRDRGWKGLRTSWVGAGLGEA